MAFAMREQGEKRMRGLRVSLHAGRIGGFFGGGEQGKETNARVFESHSRPAQTSVTGVTKETGDQNAMGILLRNRSH